MQEEKEELDKTRLVEMEEKVNELRKNKTNKQQNRPKFRKSNVTGLLKGEITDIEVSEKGVYNTRITISTDRGDKKIRVKEPDEYTTDYTLVRLLEWKGVVNIGNLIGKDVTLVKNAPPYSNEQEDWELYMPEKDDGISRILFRIDNLLRRIGFQSDKPYDTDSIKTLIGINLLGYFVSGYMLGCTYLLFHDFPVQLFLLTFILPYLIGGLFSIYKESERVIGELRE